MASAMNSPAADQFQAEFSYGPPPPQVPFLMGPATRQIQNPHHIFMNYPQPVPLRSGPAFQPLQMKDGCPGIDLMALQPAPQASTPELYPAPNYCLQAGTQQPNHVQSMHSQPAAAGFNGYHQPPPNAWYSQPSVNVTRAASQGIPAGQASPRVSLQTPQPSVNITGTAPQGRSVSQSPREGSPQVLPQALPQALQPSVNIAGAAPWGTLGSQSLHGSHQSFTDIAGTALQEILVNQSPQTSVSTTGTDPQGRSASHVSHGSHQPSTNIAVTAPQKSPVSQPSQPSVGITGAAPQGRSVDHKGLQVHSKIHGSQVNGIKKSTSIKPPVRKKLANLITPERLKQSPRKAQPQKPHKPVPVQRISPNEPIPPYDLNKPTISPPPPAVKDILERNGCVRWETDLARHLHRNNVMGLYKIGDWLCDMHVASGKFVKVANRDVTPDGEHFWRHAWTNQRVHSAGGEDLNGKVVHLSNGALAWMEGSQGETIVPKWQIADPVVLKSEPKELEYWSVAIKEETPTTSGLKPGCDPMWF